MSLDAGGCQASSINGSFHTRHTCFNSEPRPTKVDAARSTNACCSARSALSDDDGPAAMAFESPAAPPPTSRVFGEDDDVSMACSATTASHRPSRKKSAKASRPVTAGLLLGEEASHVAAYLIDHMCCKRKRERDHVVHTRQCVTREKNTPAAFQPHAPLASIIVVPLASIIVVNEQVGAQSLFTNATLFTNKGRAIIIF